MVDSKYLIQERCIIKDALLALNNLSDDALTLFVLDNEQCMVGTLTDGDIRRGFISGLALSSPVSSVMKRDFYFLRQGHIDVELVHTLRQKGIYLLPCLDVNNRIVAIYNLFQFLSVLPVDAVLMAGGKGERLRPLTENTPKPLLPVGDKAIIDYNVDRLISYGVENISVTVNYLKEQIEDHFATPRKGVQVRCVREPKFLGTIGSVRFVESFYNDTILVMNSDLFTNIDYEDFFLHFKRNNADMSVVAVPYSVNIPYGIFELEGRNIQSVKEKPSYNYYVNAGIYLIKKALLKLIPDEVYFNATDFMDLLIQRKYKVIRFPITGYWIDIGKHEEYRKVQELVKHIK